MGCEEKGRGRWSIYTKSGGEVDMDMAPALVSLSKETSRLPAMDFENDCSNHPNQKHMHVVSSSSYLSLSLYHTHTQSTFQQMAGMVTTGMGQISMYRLRQCHIDPLRVSSGFHHCSSPSFAHLLEMSVKRNHTLSHRLHHCLMIQVTKSTLLLKVNTLTFLNCQNHLSNITFPKIRCAII